MRSCLCLPIFLRDRRLILFENHLIKQLVLIGGGHANVQILKKLCMNRIKGLHTILISEHFEATYSGMTPGYIHRDFSIEEISIDLQRLCFNAGATFIKDKVIKLETNNKKVVLQNFPSINYDLLSINTGSISNTKGIKIEKLSKCFFAKPISSLVKNLSQIDQIISNKKNRISIIGGGVASYELAFSLLRRYENNLDIAIFGKNILKEKNLNERTKKNLKKISSDLGIKEYLGEVVSITETHLVLNNGEKFDSDLNILSSGANIETWLSESNLNKDKNGFIDVDNNLLSTSDKNIFVTGDACTVEDNFRPKSGVMAVRQGQVLKENVFSKLTGMPLINFKAQKNWLYLIGTHKNKALLNYFFLSFHGQWCWKLKEWIDRGFINKFKFTYNANMSFRYFELEKPKDIKMYCQGCGSKVSKNTLINFLYEENSQSDLPDSSIINTNSSSLLQSIDHIKLFTSLNPFDFGIISYLHSQNDILSSGGSVKTISVSQALPFSDGIIESFFMEYFMKGIKSEAIKDGSIIASGHSYQSKEPGITITMNGSYEKQITKSQAQENELIYLSKPLGTGYLLAAYFNNSELLSSFDFQKLMTWMKKGNKKISEISKSFKSKITTDISGFGLASHLSDICKSSGLSAEIKLNEEILINKNIEILNKFKSTGFENNYLSSANEISISDNNKLQNILYDPQTNGPLLISIEKEDQIKFEKEFQSIIGFSPILLGQFKKFKKKLINVIN